MTGGQGVDTAFDSTYLPSSYAKSIEAVKPGGAWIVLSRTIQKESEQGKLAAKRSVNFVNADLSHYWSGAARAQLKSFFQGSLKLGAQWFQEGQLKPYVNRRIKLEEAENALQSLLAGKGGFGKIVVDLISD